MDFREQERGKEASDGVVCDSKQASVYEMRKEWQKHKDARKVCRTKVVDGRLKAQVGRMVLITFGRLGSCATKMGPKLMNRCKPEKWTRNNMNIC